MKHLRDFRIFESDDDDDDEDSTIHTGFEYSFNDIKDTFWDILDLGFKIKENRSCYWSEDFTRVDLTKAKWAVWEFTLEADAECETLERSYSQRNWSSQRMLMNNSNLELEVLQSVAGRISEGYICTFINTTQMTNQVRTRSLEELKNAVITLKNWYFPTNSTAELRKITKEDCKRLATIHGSTQEYMEDRYLDLDGVILTFDYKKLYDKLSKG